jgi:hypothetical protein
VLDYFRGHAVLESQRCDNCRISGRCFGGRAGLGGVQEHLGDLAVVEPADAADVAEVVVRELRSPGGRGNWVNVCARRQGRSLVHQRRAEHRDIE